MDFWSKLAAIAAAAFILFAGGYWLKGLIEEAGQADLLRQQIRANIEKQDQINARAIAAESGLAAERKKSADLNKKWSKIRESKNHAVCTLDDDTLGLLRDATVPAGLLPR